MRLDRMGLYCALLLCTGALGAGCGESGEGQPLPEAEGPRATKAQALGLNRGDFDRNGNTDILWRNPGTGENAFWSMHGTRFISSTSLPTVSADLSWTIRGTGDFNLDGAADILWRNTRTGQNAIWLMAGASIVTSVPLPDVGATSGWQIAATGDFDMNSTTDIVWRNSMDGRNSIWLMQGTSLSSTVSLPAVSATSGWNIVGAGDFDLNGTTDILWRNRATGDNGVWRMNGTSFGSYFGLSPVAANSGWQVVGTGDFDQNNSTDILWRNTSTGENGIWLMNGLSYAEWAGLHTVVTNNGWVVVGPK